MKIGNVEVYGVIYKIENLVNGKIYIGQSVNGFNGRYSYKGNGIKRVYKYHKNNKNKGRYSNIHLLNSINKYGFENFKVYESFDMDFSKEELNVKEVVWIKFYKSMQFKYGYNQNSGGNENIPTKETKFKISKNHADVSCENSSFTNLNNEIVEQIKIKLSKGIFPKEISKETGISISIVTHIKNLRAWIDVRSDLNETISNNTKSNNKSKENLNIGKLYFEEDKSIKEIIRLTKSSQTVVYTSINWCVENIEKYKEIHNSKVKKGQEIAMMFKNGISKKELMKKFNLTIRTVNRHIKKYS